jgi:hypothetical protein
MSRRLDRNKYGSDERAPTSDGKISAGAKGRSWRSRLAMKSKAKMSKLWATCIFVSLAHTSSGVAAQTSSTGQAWEGRWASTLEACQNVTCTGEADCDDTAYSFEGEILRGVPGSFVCVIAAQSSNPGSEEYTILPMSCAAKGETKL